MRAAVLERSTREDMSKQKTAVIRLYDDVIEQARIVAAIRGINMTDLVCDILRPVLHQMETEELAKRAQAIGVSARPKKPKGSE